jgi:hypothetical protein
LISRDSIFINTVSGGIVNFGGAVYISPISITKSVSGSGSENTALDIKTNSDENATEKKKTEK